LILRSSASTSELRSAANVVGHSRGSGTVKAENLRNTRVEIPIQATVDIPFSHKLMRNSAKGAVFSYVVVGKDILSPALENLSYDYLLTLLERVSPLA
jgi:hypothetical protein